MHTATLLWGLLFGSIGTGYFIYGKKQKKKVALGCGLALIGYTYFVESPIVIVLIGVVLMGIPFFIRD